MRFLAPQHGDEGWNQQEMMEFWILQCSPYSCCLRKKKEEENRRKNRCLRTRNKMTIEGRKKCTKRAWQLPESNGFFAIMAIFAIVRVIKYNTIQYTSTFQPINKVEKVTFCYTAENSWQAMARVFLWPHLSACIHTQACSLLCILAWRSLLEWALCFHCWKCGHDLVWPSPSASSFARLLEFSFSSSLIEPYLLSSPLTFHYD